MQKQTFDYMLEEIYGAFGRQKPQVGSPAWRSIFRRTCEERQLPDASAKYIANAISDYDSLPTNLGKAIIAEYGNWLSLHPELRARENRGCPECDPKTPGFIPVFTPKGIRQLAQCVCVAGWDQGWTRERLRQRGYLFEDPLARPGARLSGLCRRAVGHSEPQRPAHAAALEDAW